MTITNGNSCTNTQAVTITINPLPTITTTGTMSTLCYSAGAQTASLVYTATTNSPTSYSIDWNAAANAAGLADQGNTAFAFVAGGGTLNTIAITAATPAGTYSGTMTITNGNSCTNTQAVTITINPLPTITTTGTINALCYSAGAQTATLVYTATTNSPTSYSIDWNAAANAAGLADQGNTAFAFLAGGGNLNTIAITAATPAGTYSGTMTITNGNSCTNTKAVTITINPLPTITTTGTINALCYSAGAQTATLAYTATTNSPTSYSIDWNAAANAAGLADQGNTAFAFVAGGGNLNTIVITAATPVGTYSGTMTITNANGCTNTQAVTITINPLPTITTTGIMGSLCYNAGAQTASLVYTATTNSPTSYSIDWNAAANAAGLADQGNTAFAFAAGGGTLNTVVITAGTPGGTYNGTMTITTVNGCTATQAVTITINPLPTITTTGTIGTLCFNAGAQTATLAYTATTNSPTSYSIDWNAAANAAGLADQGNTAFAFLAGGGNLNTIAITAGTPGGTYSGTMTITNANGCTNTKAVTITINPLPTITTTGTINQVCYNAGPQTATLVYTATTNTPTSYSIDWNAAANAAGLADQANTAFGFLAGGGNLNTITITAGTPVGTYSGTMTITNANGCTNTQAVTVTVNAIPTITLGANPAVCAGTTTANLTYSATTASPDRYSITYNAAALAAGFVNVVNAVLPATPIVLTVPGAAPAATYSGTLTVTNSTTGCVSTGYAISVTINPIPTLSSTLTPADVCSNTLFSYNPTSAVGGTTFNWTRAAVAGITPAGPTSGTNNPNETLRNITSLPIPVTYQYTLSANGCTNVQNVIVNIKPEPVISAGQNPSTCSGIALNYAILMDNFANPADNVTFTWPAPVLNPISANFTGGSARGVGSSANITDTYINTTGLIGTATYTVTPVKNGCSGAPVTVVVSVGAQPVLDPGLNSTVCSNTATGLLLKVATGSVSASYYNISSVTLDAGLSANAGNAVIPNATAPANYLSNDKFTNTTGVNKNVTYHIQPILAPNCYGTATDVVITIRPQPVIMPAQTKTVCSSVAVNKEILLVPANTPAGTLFNWSAPTMSDASVQGTAGVNVAADPAGTSHITDVLQNYSSAPITATYNVVPTSSFGCVGSSVPVIITVNQEPVPQPISGRTKICITDKNVVYNVNPVAGSTFHWTVDPAVGTKTFDFNTNAILIDAAGSAGSGNITVYETNSLGCSGQTSTLPVQVYVAATPENITGPATVCANSTQTYSVTNRAGSVYSWTVPGGAAIIGDPSANSITIVFANVGGTILCRETNAAGCITNHNPKSVTVNALPTATISGGATICVGGSTNLSVAFTGTGPYTFTYALNGVSQAPVATASNPYTLNVSASGTYTIVNVTDANCTNNGAGTATVSYYPQPTGTISGTATMCKGSTTTLTITLTGTAPYNFVYTDGTTPVTVNAYPSAVYTATVSPTANTTYTMTSLSDGNSCTGVVSGSAVITVNIPPVVIQTITNLTCNGNNTGAISLAVTGNSPFGYTWTGPNGFTANTQNISGLEAGIYTVTVLDTKGCTTVGNYTVTQPAPLSATLASTNLICFGAANGTITISAPAGGSGTFEYTINGGTSWQASGNFTGLTPGTYNVQMRDAASPVCTKVLDAARVITGPAQLNATVASTNSDCNGGNNGTITISAPTGGFGTYSYSVNGGTSWQGSGSFTGLAPNSYNVMMRDAAQPTCQVTLNPAVVITEPPALNAAVASTNITCFGSADGTITITAPSGGHGTFEYSISGGSSWQATGNFTGLTPGNYNVQIRDAAYTSCYKVLNGSLAVTQPAVLNATLTTTNVTCNGANDGTISITAPSGGYGTYEYTINGGTSWQASGNYTALAPGSYDVRIRDAAHTSCTVILNNGVSITEPAVLNATVVSTNVTCNGANDGVINITNPTGGYGTFEYTINGGTTWAATGSFTGLAPNTYNVQIRDKAHTACIKVLNNALIITQPAILNATAASTNVTCNSASDGTITISSPSGGYGTYQYTVNGGTSWQGSGNFINLAPGVYNVRMRDAANITCVKILNAALTITEPAALTATVSRTNVTCFGAADGTITVNGAAGGYGTYEYTINGGSTWQASNSFTAITPGFYNVRIRDAAQPACTYTVNGSLSVTEPPILSASVAHTNVTCNGANDGTITISSASGGYGTYEYSINGGTSWQASGSFTALAPASYDVRIRDAAHVTCVVTLNGTLTITEPALLGASVASTNVTCNGAADGTITITGSAGGYGTYEYTINGGTTWSGLGTFTNLAPNTYNIKIRDAAHTGCVITLNGALVITQPSVLSATVGKTNVTCFGSADGTITITAPTGGYGTYEYSVNGGGSWQASGSFTGLGPGNYNVQIRDAAHITCVKVLNNSLSITQPAALNAVVTPIMVTCNGANDGIIAITGPTGGYGTYEYSISGGTSWQASGNFTALAPATYDVRIRDAANTACVIILNSSLAITEPAILSASLNSTNVSCFGANDGTITITAPTGGYGTYEYTINGGTTWQTTANYTGLTPATYNVQMRDKAHTGCVKVLNAALVITQPAVLNATVASTNVTCNGASNGTITVSGATGGYGSYQYSINGGASWQGTGNFTGLAPATYDVRLRDAAHTSCEVTLNGSLVITQPNVLSATVAKTNVNCFGAGDGTITITSPLGGYGTYEYTVNGGISWQASGNFTALIPGFYNVEIRDAANAACVVTLNGSLQITEPAVLSAVVTKTDITCNGANDGKITISSPTGGYGTYEYSVNGGAAWQASGSFTNLTPGSYNVEIRDAAHTSCVIILNAALAITEPAVLNATVASTNVTCFGSANGTITISAPSGGYGTYQYTVNNGVTWQASGSFTGLAPASYNVKIRDAVNTACVVTLNPALSITQPAVLNASVASTNVTCFGAADGTITISSPTGGHGTFEYTVNGGGSWQASGSFTGLGPGTYNVEIRDAAYTSCVIVLNNSLTLTQPAVLNAVVTPAMVTCNGANDGKITITSPSGGYGTYQYSINGGGAWQASGSFTGLAPATYDVRIRDAAQTACVIILNSALVITEPSVLNASVASTNITCNGANDGTITISAPTGGYGTYEYSINGGAAWQSSGNFTALLPSTYNVQIRDKVHTSCVVTLNGALVITQPNLLSATVNSTNVTCNGANDGTITITSPLGGYGTYQYSVNNGATWQGSGSFTGLANATYNVKIRDAANTACVITLNPALVITQPAKLNATVASTNVTCFGAADGTISITAPSGGYGTYEFTVNGGTTWQASGNFTALAPGFYNVQIRDAANTSCVVTLNGSLRITEPSVLAAFVASTNVTCNGANDGTITISSPTGGYGTYEYSINGGTSWQASGNFTALAPSTYNVEIRDAAHTGCVIVLNAALVITQPPVLNATVTPTMVTCFGASDGIITISSPTGGYGTYQYSVNGGTTWQGSGTFMSLAPANYNVQIRDASHNACVITLNAALAITQPTVLNASISSTNVTCFGGNDGTLTISGPTGGYGTYEYSVNGGGSWQASGSFTSLSPGNYNVMIRDAAHTGCMIVLNASYAITQPALLSATVAKTDVTCNGLGNGTITISSPTGGYGTFEYSINGGTSWQASGNFTGLAPGTYNVRMRDAAHTACYVILYPNLVINEPLTLVMTTSGNVALPCFGDMTGSGTFYAAGGTLPYTFNLVSNTTGGVLVAPGFNSQSFFAAGAGSVTVSVTDAKGCTAQNTIAISQPANLTPGSIAADQVICNGSNPAMLTQVTAPTGGPAAYVYQWQYSAAAGGPFINIAGATSGTYTPPAGATATLYYRRMVTSGTCTAVYSNVVEILVNPKPVAMLTGGETICPGQSSNLVVNMMAGTGPFTLNIQNLGVVNNYTSGNNIVVTPAATTTYALVSAQDANGCLVTAPSANLIGSATVTVRALPAITVQPANKTTCEFGMVTFGVTATGDDLTYQWYVNEGSGFTLLTDGGVYFGSQTSSLMIFGATRDMNTYSYHCIVSGCSTNVTSNDVVLTVNTAPEILNQPTDSTICQGANASFSATAQGTGLVYQWQRYSGGTWSNLTDGANFSGSGTATLNVINAPGSFNNTMFRLKLTGTCGVPVYSTFVFLRVNVPPAATLNPANKAICENGGPVYFTANGSGMIDSLRWQVFTGGTWQDIHDGAVYSGTTSQQLTLVNVPLSYNSNQYRLALKAYCSTTYTSAATLTVHANPVVDFSAVSPIAACGGVPVVLNGNPTGGSGTYTQHTWTGDVGPLNNYFIQSPTFNSQIAGTYNLNYKVRDSNGCTANNNLVVNVDAPDATFSTDVNIGCTPLAVNFTKDMTGIAKFWWDFGDLSPKDSVNANPSHNYINATPATVQYYTVTLKVRSAGGCFATFSTSVTVFPQIDASFTADKNVVCSGSAITYTAMTGASKYFWDYGDGTSGYASYVSSHPYTNLTTAPETLTVKLTTTSFYSCSNSQTMLVVVMPVPIPDFTANPVSQIFNAGGNPVAFTNTTNAGTWNWAWTFGDGGTSTAQNPGHSYTGIGSYDVVLRASNANCSDSIRHQVSVIPVPPVPNFDSIPSTCAPLSVTINNTSLNVATPGITYTWDFGDGSPVLHVKNPTYTYFTSGTYRITLTIKDAYGNSYQKSQLVTAYDSPKANFTAAPTTVYVNDEAVRFFNNSQKVDLNDYYVWDFGDGDTSHVSDPYHKYMDQGVFDITLHAYSSNGCMDSWTLSPGVTVEPAGVLRFATVFTPNPSGPIDINHLPTGGTEIDQFFFPPIREKVLDYKLQIFNRWGTLIFESHDINKPWNGYYKGKLCKQGVYVWFVEGKYANGKPFKKVGDVTLLH
ncbi:MAG TPA: PKD domain-containing protein [Bacteroidales bacterium]|nr:PKD domain-containing protein [Bacteroidales bacterium]